MLKLNDITVVDVALYNAGDPSNIQRLTLFTLGLNVYVCPSFSFRGVTESRPSIGWGGRQPEGILPANHDKCKVSNVGGHHLIEN